MAEIWEVTERRITWLAGFDASWLPSGVAGKIQVLTRGSDHVGIEVGGWVGSVTLKNGDTLQIRSKFGSVNFMRMLLRADGLQNYAEDESQYAVGEDSSPLDFIAPSFIRSLRQIHSQGSIFRWETVRTVSTSKPTMVSLPKTAMRMQLGKQELFEGRTQRRTTELPESRVLALAATFILRTELGQSLPSVDQRLLGHFARRRYAARSVQADLRSIQIGLLGGAYAGSRGYYIAALRQALVVLGINGITTNGSADTSGSAFLTNSDLLFERYVRTVLFEFHKDAGISFEKEEPNSSYLFGDGTETMEPDILVRKGIQISSLGDVKHKRVDISDYFQMFTYLRQYGLRQGFVLQADEDGTEGVRRLITTRDGVEIVVIPLPISDLAQVETTLSELGSVVDL